MKSKYLLPAAFALVACNADEPSFNFPFIEPEDVTVQVPDVHTDAGDDTGTPATGRVELDLTPHLRAAEGTTRIYQISAEDQLIPGPISHGKIGDWVLENDRVRFLIEGDDRVMNPCPYGGTVLDISYLEGDSRDDILGEVCLFINAAQTLDPETFEVIDTGTNAAVLAVTGKLQLGDYINIKGTVDDFIPGLSDKLPINPDDILPVTVTVYYLLEPGALGLRVLTALRNDSDTQVDAVIAHLVMSGGDGGYFNPMGNTSGFGAGGGSFGEDPVPFVAFRGEQASYMFMPDVNPELAATVLPYGGTSLTISGVAAVAADIASIIGTLTSRNFAEAPGVMHLPPGATDFVGHWHFGGDGAVSTMLDEAYPLMGIETGWLEGQILDNGAPAAGVRVSAVSATGEPTVRRTMSQAITGADGKYRMRVPTGTYELHARRNSQTARSVATEQVASEATATASNLTLSRDATLIVNIKDPSGQPTPGRVTVMCDGACPQAPTSLETDISTNKLPFGWQSVTWAGMDGRVELSVPPGNYKVVVTRGFEWSTWPYDAMMGGGGHSLSVADDDEVTLEAEIAHVVDTSGALSGDFHVHALPSPDSPVPLTLRALNFLGEGVDVIVSTDHDIISDYAPSIAKLGAGAELASLIGAEITTGNTGHFNAFPLQQDLTERRGGNLDWGRGPLNDMEVDDIFAWAHQQPGEQVVQLNHPSGMGLISNARVDVLRGLSFKPRDQMRMDPQDPDPITGDTGIWSEDFTALEVMTGSGIDRFYSVGRWWLQMVARGFTPTATAVTDTHKLYGDLGGSPRTYVFVPPTADSASTFDGTTFTTAVNQGKAIGSRGPFFRVEVVNSTGATGSLGDVVATNGQTVTAKIKIDAPEWMPVNTIEVFMNLTDEILTTPGESSTEPWTPTLTVPIPLGTEDLQEVAVGTAVHRHYVKEIEIPLTSADDAYVVFVVRGSTSMNPLAPGQVPFAFANPVYLDADGNGYDNPPLKDLAQTLPPQVNMIIDAHAAEHLGPNGELPELTPELLSEALEHGTCQH